jgi:hypothetical protein
MPFLESAHATDLRNAHLTDVHGDQIIHNYHPTTSTSTGERALEALKPAMREGYDVPRCMEGTRESVFKEVDSWLDDVSACTTSFYIVILPVRFI